MLYVELADVSRRLAATSKRSEKAALLADLLRRLAPDEVAVAVGRVDRRPPPGSHRRRLGDVARRRASRRPSRR